MSVSVLASTWLASLQVYPAASQEKDLAERMKSAAAAAASASVSAVHPHSHKGLHNEEKDAAAVAAEIKAVSQTAAAAAPVGKPNPALSGVETRAIPSFLLECKS